MRSVAAALLVLCLAAPLAAQKLSESIEVHVVNVDVVVTDRTGKHITGLTQDDFEVFEDQRPQKITNLYEVHADAAIPATPAVTAQEVPPKETQQRRFVFFIDNDSLHPMVRDQAVASIKKFIEQQFRPGDEASVVNWNNGIQILQELTADKAALNKAVDRVRGLSSPASINSDLGRVQKHCIRVADQPRGYDDCINEVRMAAMQATLTSRRMANAMGLAIATLAGVEGKKVLVLASTRLPERPGLDMYIWANQLFTPRMHSFDAAMARPMEETRNQKEVLDELARTANAHGVTLYLLNAAVLTNPMPIENIRGPIPMDGGSDLDRQNTDAAFQMLAEKTGGVAVKGPLNFDDALATVARDLDSYYSLGYRPSNNVRGDRSIMVKAKNREYIVRARQGYALQNFDDQMSDQVVANIFTPSRSSGWSISARTGKPQRDGRNFKVPVEVVMPSTVMLLPKGEDRLAGGFTVYIAVGSPKGALSTVSRSPQPVGMKRAEEAAFRKEPIVFSAVLTVAPGENFLSIGVVDQVSNTTGFARTKIVAQ